MVCPVAATPDRDAEQTKDITTVCVLVLCLCWWNAFSVLENRLSRRRCGFLIALLLAAMLPLILLFVLGLFEGLFGEGTMAWVWKNFLLVGEWFYWHFIIGERLLVDLAYLLTALVGPRTSLRAASALVIYIPVAWFHTRVTLFYWHYLVIKQRLNRDDPVVRQLNGANGEHTGLDDVNLNAVQAEKRVKNKRKKAIHSVQQRLAARAEKLDAVAEVEEAPVYEWIVAVPDLDKYNRVPVIMPDGTFGVATRIVAGGVIVAQSLTTGSKCFAHVACSGQYQRHTANPGVYKYSPDEDEIILKPAFELQVLVLDPIQFPAGRKCWVFLKLVEVLKKEFRVPELTERNRKGFVCLATKLYPSLPAEYVSSSVISYEKYVSSLLVANVTTHPTLVKMDMMDSEARPLMDLGLPANLGSTFFTFGVRNTLEDLTDNGLFEAERLKGCVNHKLENGVPHPCLVNFDTPNNERPKLQDTWYCRLVGADSKGFVTYDRSGYNMTRAAARMYKQRPEEFVLQYNQLFMFNYLDWDPTVDAYCSNMYDTYDKYLQFSQDLSTRAGYPMANPMPLDPVRLGVLSFTRSCFTHMSGQFDGSHLSRYLSPIVRLGQAFVRLITVVCLFYPVLALFTYDNIVARFSYVDTPRPKRALYKMWYDALQIDTVQAFCEQPEAKVKWELGKVGKFARLYVTYGSNILQGGWLYEYMKKCICATYEFVAAASFPLWLRIYYSRTDEGIRPKGAGVYVQIFSDDSNWVIVTPCGRWFFVKVDVSSCDASMRSGLFRFAGRLIKKFTSCEHLKMLYHQFRQSILLINPSNSAERFYLKVKDVFMGSGSPDTTFMNNIYNFGIVCAAYYMLCREHNLVTNPGAPFEFNDGSIIHCIQRGAWYMGAVVTVEVVSGVEETDFLKVVPYPECPALALGPILRGLGGVPGQLTPAMLNLPSGVFNSLDDAERMELRVGGVVKGYCNEPGSIILDALRERFTRGEKIELDEHKGVHTDRSAHYISVESLQARYGGTHSEWVNFANDLRKIVLGDALVSPILGRIYKVDYGLAPGVNP